MALVVNKYKSHILQVHKYVTLPTGKNLVFRSDLINVCVDGSLRVGGKILIKKILVLVVQVKIPHSNLYENTKNK